jgi:hypothetical protein
MAAETEIAPPRYMQHGEREQCAPLMPPFHHWAFADGTIWILFFRDERGYVLRFPQLADFEVANDGNEVHAWAAPGTTSATVQHLYINQVLPLALSRQGKLVLHASAVDVGSRSVAFVGPSGRGKSTLATSFATSGARFLTDDGLQLEWHRSQLMVLPSHPSVRLWADSQEALIAPGAAVAPPVGYTAKARFLAGPLLAFCDTAQPLRSIFYLGTDDVASVKIERMKAPAALLELVRHSFLLDIDEREILASHFDEISRIANLPIHYHLDYPRRFGELPVVRQAILAHAEEGLD